MKSLLLLVLFVAGAVHAENLLPDPSFEQTMERDRWGHVFSEWEGWIFEAPARFEVGRIAHSGRTSCELVGVMGTKIRMYSKQLPLPAGRYRVTAFLRMIDVTSEENQYGRGMDFTVEAGNKWFNSHHWRYRQGDELVVADGQNDAGDHGWRQLTYVFDVAAGTNVPPARVQFGLWDQGQVWIDDVVLERVDAAVALTPQTVVGEESAPIAPPGPLGANRLRCPACAFWTDPAWGQCYRCGAAVKMAAALTAPAVQPFGERRQLDQGYVEIKAPADWSQHDYVRLDVTNPQDEPVMLDLEIRDAATRDYWTRVNASRFVPPGTHTVSLPTRHYVGEKARPGRMLLRDQVTRFVVAVGNNGPVTLDHFRLERLDTSVVRFPELIAFDFGPPGTPVLDGFRAGTGMGYAPGRGFGWIGARFWNNRSTQNALQPEALTEDCVCPEVGTFRLDVPNGRYRVWMIIDSPGGYWGEVQTYRRREVFANGQPVIADTLDAASFIRWYFRNADREDPPEVDVYAAYVRPRCAPKQFTVEVTDGKLALEFRGANRAIALAALVVFPETRQAEGDRFLAWVDTRRREQFEEGYRLLSAPPVGAAAPTEGYRVFQRPFMDPVGPRDGPRDGEELGAGPLIVTIARGEEMPLTFSVQPGEALGTVTLTMSAFTSRGGAALDPAALRPGWIDYRITRVRMDGAGYAVRPRYWRELPAPAAPVTRRVWIRVQAPTDAVPGEYTGTITVKPQRGGAREVPVTVRVLPFALAEIDDVAVGPWGCSIDLPWLGDDPATKEWNTRLLEDGLAALRAGGFTSCSLRLPLTAQAAQGRVTLQTDDADRMLALVRAKGFDKLISVYGTRTVGYNLYQGLSDAQAEAAGFTNAAAFIRGVWQAVDAHAVANNWPPLAWNVCDEPVGDAIAAAVRVAELHRAAAAGLQRTTFMGATSFAGSDITDPHAQLALALPLPALNTHDHESLGLLHAAGNQLSFYNGGNRWTYGRYLKALVQQYQLALRLSWHYNVVAGDPYYALDCREDDYCWYNSNAAGELVPAVRYLGEILPGLNDYRYFCTLEKLIEGKRAEAAKMTGFFDRWQKARLEKAIARAEQTIEELLALTAGPDRAVGEQRVRERRFADYAEDRARVITAIGELSR